MVHGSWLIAVTRHLCFTADGLLHNLFLILTKVDQQAVVQSQVALCWDFSIIPHFFKAKERKKKRGLREKNFHTRFVRFYSVVGTYFVKAKYDVTSTFRESLKHKIMSEHHNALWLNAWKCTDFKLSCMEFDLGTNYGFSPPGLWPVPFQTICRFNLQCISTYRGKVLQLYLSMESQQSQLARCSLLI